jgi:hypothetical protein
MLLPPFTNTFFPSKTESSHGSPHVLPQEIRYEAKDVCSSSAVEIEQSRSACFLGFENNRSRRAMIAISLLSYLGCARRESLRRTVYDCRDHRLGINICLECSCTPSPQPIVLPIKKAKVLEEAQYDLP